MLFRLTADTDGRLIGCCDTRTVNDGRRCWPSKTVTDSDGRQ